MLFSQKSLNLLNVSLMTTKTPYPFIPQSLAEFTLHPLSPSLQHNTEYVLHSDSCTRPWCVSMGWDGMDRVVMDKEMVMVDKEMSGVVAYVLCAAC